VWTPEYAVDGVEMDREHETWFDILNRLHEAMLLWRRGGTPANDLRGIVDHFVHEEELMAAAHYPGLWEHVQGHDELREIAREWARRFERGSSP